MIQLAVFQSDFPYSQQTPCWNRPHLRTLFGWGFLFFILTLACPYGLSMWQPWRMPPCIGGFIMLSGLNTPVH